MTEKMELKVIQRVRSGEINAFEFLVKRYEKPLFIMISNMLKGNPNVEDMVQDAFLSAYQSIDKFRPDKGSFSTWLFRIARNKCLNEIHRKKDILMESLPDISSSETPDRWMIQKQTFLQLDEALQRMNTRDRMIFILAEINELTYAEIAEIEHIRIGTVKSRLFRTKEKLSQLLRKVKG